MPHRQLNAFVVVEAIDVPQLVSVWISCIVDSDHLRRQRTPTTSDGQLLNRL